MAGWRQVKAFEEAAKRREEGGDRSVGSKGAGRPRKGQDSRLPGDDAVNPHLGVKYAVPPVAEFVMTKTYRAHDASVSAIAFHPTNSILATVSDDCSWKMWTVPGGELVMSGDGHRCACSLSAARTHHHAPACPNPAPVQLHSPRVPHHLVGLRPLTPPPVSSQGLRLPSCDHNRRAAAAGVCRWCLPLLFCGAEIGLRVSTFTLRAPTLPPAPVMVW
jgi:hypothetical protein